MNRPRLFSASTISMLVLMSAVALRADQSKSSDVDDSDMLGPVVIQTSHPIHRPKHKMVIRRPSVVMRVAPTDFTSVEYFSATVVPAVDADKLVWQDSETLSKKDNWSEIVFNSDQHGSRLYLEIVKGRVEFDYAEVVFENGSCQVVDFSPSPRDAGLYTLLQLRTNRKIDHVRLIARSKSDDAKVTISLER